MTTRTPKFSEERSAVIREQLILLARRNPARTRTRAAVAGIVVLGALAGTAAAAVAVNAGWIGLPSTQPGVETSFAPIPNWPVNANGQTYGDLGDSPISPDLVRVLGVDSAGEPTYGYVYATALSTAENGGDPPTSPEQALQQQHEQEERYPDGQHLPMYASDGVTLLGYFQVGGH